MTSEVAVLNTGAVALAADSAVTIGGSPRRGGADKIFNSVNKLFTLSKYHPVGIMIFGRADLNGIPWETIIKQYRKHLGSKSFPTVDFYCRDFIDFLRTDNTIFTQDVQDHAFLSCASSFLVSIRDGFNKKIKDLMNSKGQIPETEVQALLESHCAAEVAKWDSADFLPNASESHMTRLLAHYEPRLVEVLNGIFERLPICPQTASSLLRACTSIPIKARFHESFHSGLVIAGFGDIEVLPSLCEMAIGLRVIDYLKHRVEVMTNISVSNRAQIFSFAQGDMVNAFMEGMDPNYRKFCEGYLEHVFERLPNLVLSALGLSDSTPNLTMDRLKAVLADLAREYKEKSVEYSQKHHIGPVIDIVASLPKEELAEMAEALVSLTSFKKKVSPDAETVGGPVDVALITKGDGFVWIKRKHYFKPELNSHFFANYFRDSHAISYRRRSLHGR